MQVLLFIIVIGWLTTLPALVWWCLGTVVLIGVGVCGYFALDQFRPPRRRLAAIDPSYVAALETLVSKAETEMEALRAEIVRLRSKAVVSEPDPKVALYNRVGLSPGAPVWLVAAARKAYRVRLHPDGHPAHRKREAERRFVLAERVFDEIATSRQ
jgi:hypothetical protein